MADDSNVAVVTVAYGRPQMQVVVEIGLAPGLTAREAVDRSGLLERFPEIDAGALVLGIYGQRVGESQLLRAGDRVEICRPLRQDPRDMRREALAAGTVMGRPKE
ncbi:MAG TPA: RnfH family protein [Gammaproteobacteria bacterium]|nr:RnfH family protein [Gammaproteobacteria bacterium]